jgi:hypothetical protein
LISEDLTKLLESLIEIECNKNENEILPDNPIDNFNEESNSIKILKKSSLYNLENVTKEYNLLLPLLHKIGIDEEHELFKQLYKINLEFWEYHDWQREKWASLKKSATIIDIELYRRNEEEHILNDKRAEIKKKINKMFNSDIIEEKQFKSYEI